MKLLLRAATYVTIGYACFVTAFTVPSIQSTSRLSCAVYNTQNNESRRCKTASIMRPSGAGRQENCESGSSLQFSRRAGLFGKRTKADNALLIKEKFSTFLAISLKKFRRLMTISIASAVLCLGPLSHTPFSQRPVAHASSIATKLQSSHESRLDKMINNYVQQHMFDDDQFDPLESTYREIINDSTSGSYPKKLSTIASNLGATQTASTASDTSEKTASNDSIMKAMLKLVNTLEDKYNIPRSILVPVLALICFGVPSFAIGMGALSFSFAQRGMTERMAIERYGESDLNAEELEIKEEDDDEDYDYEEEDDDDEDDDDDDDEDTKN